MRMVRRGKGSGWLVVVLGWVLLPLGLAAAPLPTPVILSGTPGANVAAAPEQDIFVLCYHRFLNQPPGEDDPVQTEYETLMDDFKWQMDYLKENGFTPISQEQLMGYWFQGKPLPLKPVLLTFDDGFESIYRDAFPVVKQMGFPAILFLYTDFVKNRESVDIRKEKKDAAPLVDPKRPKKALSEMSSKMRFGALSDEEMIEMQKTGFVIESHTTHHLNMGLVREKKGTEKFSGLLWKELTEPFGYIEKRFGRKPQWLAYPFGVYDPEILESTKEAGYELAFTVNPGPNDRTISPFLLKRNLVLWPFGKEAFKRMLRDKVLHCQDLTPTDGAYIDPVRPLISAKITDDIDPKSVRLQIGPHLMKLKYDAKTGVYSHRPNADLTQGGHILSLTAKDRQGNRRVFNWYFRIKHQRLVKKQEARDAQDAI